MPMGNMKISDTAKNVVITGTIGVLAIGKGLAYGGLVASRLVVPLVSVGVLPATAFGVFQSILGNAIYLAINGFAKTDKQRFVLLVQSHFLSSGVVGALALTAIRTGLIASTILNPAGVVALATLGVALTVGIGCTQYFTNNLYSSKEKW